MGFQLALAGSFDLLNGRFDFGDRLEIGVGSCGIVVMVLQHDRAQGIEVVGSESGFGPLPGRLR
jgi:hypothetical protein